MVFSKILRAVPLLLAAIPLTAAELKDRTVEVNGHKVHMRVSESDTAMPAIVFESGLGDDSGSWNTLLRLLPSEETLAAWDRPGLGASEPDGQSPTTEHVAAVLHAALKEAGVKPPYVLVGHSFGGPRIRQFAGMYPKEVAGLVFIDPTDFTLNREREVKEVFEPLGLHAEQRDAFHAFVESMYRHAPPNIRNELSVASAAERDDFRTVNENPVPDVPIVVLIASGHGEVPTGGPKPPVDMARLFPQQVRANVASFTDWGTKLSEVTVVLTPNSSHYIQNFEPELVRIAIDRVTHPNVGRRLERAFDAGGAPQMAAELALIERSYPANKYAGIVLDSYARTWLSTGRAPAAKALAEIDAKRDANIWQAHMTVARACLQTGDRDCALRSVNRILELDPANSSAKQMLASLK